MRGGYAWRLSTQDVKFKDVEYGPTGWSLTRDKMFIVNDPLTGKELMDNSLSPVEEDLMCGSYRCLTGKESPQRDIVLPCSSCIHSYRPGQPKGV